MNPKAGRKKGKREQWILGIEKDSKMIDLNPIIWIITLNVSGLSTLSKGTDYHIGLKKKQGPTVYSVQETHFKYSDTKRLKVKGWKKYIMLTPIKRKLEWHI